MIKFARHAVRAAMKVRSDLGYAPDAGLCPFEVAETLGIPTRLVAVNSLEGVYFPSPVKRIFIGSRRPLSRQRFTCAHEIGHHIYGHGKCLATSGPVDTPSDEFIANRFAAALLMPKLTILGAFQRYGGNVENPKPLEVWRVSQALGVGYKTLIMHLHIVMQTFSEATAESLLKAKLPKIRSEALGFPLASGNAWIIDSSWGDRTVDIQVGDVLKVPNGFDISGNCFAAVPDQSDAYLATMTGEVGVMSPAGKVLAIVRVSAKDFEGLAQYRFLAPEGGDDQ